MRALGRQGGIGSSLESDTLVGENVQIMNNCSMKKQASAATKEL